MRLGQRSLVVLAISIATSGLPNANAVQAQQNARGACGESPPRASYAMTYDPSRKLVVIFGGEAADQTLSNELWGWNGHEWRCINGNGANAPRPRGAAMLAFDAKRNVLVLYGGRVGREPLRDTWEFAAAGWTRRDSVGPTPDPHGTMAFDASTGAVLLYHSLGDDGPARKTWRWDGHAWATAASGPDVQFPNAMFASDSKHPATLVTAHSTGARDVFEPLFYEWRKDHWAAMTLTGAVPHFSPQAPAARTPTGALLYAGFEPDGTVSTSILDGTVWRRYTGESPHRRRGVQMTFDPSRNVVVLHGGDDSKQLIDETWEWNGAQWRKVR